MLKKIGAVAIMLGAVCELIVVFTLILVLSGTILTDGQSAAAWCLFALGFILLGAGIGMYYAEDI